MPASTCEGRLRAAVADGLRVLIGQRRDDTVVVVDPALLDLPQHHGGEPGIGLVDVRQCA